MFDAGKTLGGLDTDAHPLVLVLPSDEIDPGIIDRFEYRPVYLDHFEFPLKVVAYIDIIVAAELILRVVPVASVEKDRSYMAGGAY